MSMNGDYLTNQNTNEGSNDNGYFAAGSPQKVAGACLARSQSFYNTLNANYYLDKLARMWQFYHGEYGDNFSGASHSVGFNGEQGELVVLPVNHFRNIASHMLQMITATRPSMQCRSINTDYKSLAQTYLANSILDYYMREKGLEGCINRATEMAVVLGSGFVRLEWNATGGELYDFDPDTKEKNFEGEIEFSTLSPFDVVFDGTKETWDNDWIITRSYKNKYDLMAKYPEQADKINNVATKDMSTVYRVAVFTNDVTDDVAVYEFFHKRTEALPEGRYTLFLAEDVILLDMPLPYREIPIYRVAAGEFMGTPYGYSPMFDVYPIQEAINSTFSSIMTNQSAFAVQNLWVPRGADLDINSLEGAMNIIEGNAKPEPLNLTETPAEVFNFLNILIQQAETISGVNSVVRGDPQTSLKSGSALALVQSQSLQFMSNLQNNYIKLIEDIGRSLINILKDYATTPKTVAMVGKTNRAFLKEFIGEDINSISRVIVDVGNPLAKSTAGRVQMAEQLLQMGLIDDPKTYFEVMTTGSIETMYQSDMDELLLIRSENEQMMEGKSIIADMLDTHAMHIMEHRSVMADPDLRKDPNLRQIVQQHLQDHINFLRTVDPDLLQLTGQHPLANPGSPQQAPQMQGPPPPPQQKPKGPHSGPRQTSPHGPNGKSSIFPTMMPQQALNPQEMLNGQGTQGGGMIPPPARPPR